MLTLAILCSGQGPQAKGMFDLVADAPEAQPVFAEAARALGGRDAREIASTGSADDLHANATAQVLCCAQALAVWAVLKPKLEARLVVAGYSVGEMAAWGVAGALDPAAVFDLVARRAAAMDEATDGPAGLIAVRGLSPSAIDALCRDAEVHVAIRNGSDRVILGGRRDALDHAAAAAKERGAAGVVSIPVAVPSHTPLLREAAAAFRRALGDRTDVREPEARLISGIDGAAVFDVSEGLDKLGRQVAQTVDWAACMQSCRSAGASRALELGPGDALANMMGSVIDPDESRSVAEFRSVEGILRWLRRPGRH